MPTWEGIFHHSQRTADYPVASTERQAIFSASIFGLLRESPFLLGPQHASPFSFWHQVNETSFPGYNSQILPSSDVLTGTAMSRHTCIVSRCTKLIWGVEHQCVESTASICEVQRVHFPTWIKHAFSTQDSTTHPSRLSIGQIRVEKVNRCCQGFVDLACNRVQDYQPLVARAPIQVIGLEIIDLLNMLSHNTLRNEYPKQTELSLSLREVHRFQ